MINNSHSCAKICSAHIWELMTEAEMQATCQGPFSPQHWMFDVHCISFDVQFYLWVPVIELSRDSLYVWSSDSPLLVRIDLPEMPLDPIGWWPPPLSTPPASPGCFSSSVRALKRDRFVHHQFLSRALGKQGWAIQTRHDSTPEFCIRSKSRFTYSSHLSSSLRNLARRVLRWGMNMRFSWTVWFLVTVLIKCWRFILGKNYDIGKYFLYVFCK